jgi:hypothetical protein
MGFRTRSSTRKLGLAALALAAALGAGTSHAVTSEAERSHCDPWLAPASNYPFKYVDRGDRCEGVYSAGPSIGQSSGSTYAGGVPKAVTA